MRKTYTLEDLDCANCAAKMETLINKLPGVEKATVTFMTSRLSLTVPEDTDLPALLKQVQNEIHKVDSNCNLIVK